jgi:hypothetical protein
LIKWTNLPTTAATWEHAYFIRKIFPSFHPWGHLWSLEGAVVTHLWSEDDTYSDPHSIRQNGWPRLEDTGSPSELAWMMSLNGSPTV